MKYSALGDEGGTVQTSWTVEQPVDNQRRVTFNRIETNEVKKPVQPRGEPRFGLRLMRDSIQQLGGTFVQNWAGKGLDTSFTRDVDNSQ